MPLTSLQNHFTQLYLAAFKRAPELSGLNYWIAEAQAKGVQFTQGIIFSLPTVQAIYPAAMSDAEFVEAIYQNVFGRASDAEGMTYWSNEIAALRATYTQQGSPLAAEEARGQLVMNMINAGLGTPDGTDGKAFIVNRMEVATHAVETQLAQNTSLPVTFLLDTMATVNENTPSVPPAECAIDRFFNASVPAHSASITTVMDDAGQITGMVADNGTTDDTTPTLQGALETPLALCESVEVLRNGQVVGVATVNGTNWSFADAGLVNGQYAYSVRVVDIAGNVGASSSDYRIVVETATLSDTTPPVLQQATVSGYLLTLTYNETLLGSSDAAAGSFTVMVDGLRVNVLSVDAQGSFVSLILDMSVRDDQTVTLSYIPPASKPTEDQAGNDAAAFSNIAVTNITPGAPDTAAPVLQTAAVNGATLTLTYNETLNPSADAAPENFSVLIDGIQVAVNSVDANSNTVTLSLASAVNCNQSVSLSYTPPAANPTEDVAGNDAASFSDQSVTNLTPIPAPFIYTPNAGTDENSSDASTAIALDDTYMLVGDDEANVLRVYERDGGDAVLEWNYEANLGISKELDLEASARVDNTLYFIGSHSNKSGGDEADNREHIFSVEISGTGAATALTFGQSFDGLESALATWDSSNGHGKGADYFGFDASSEDGIAPEQANGFSIEGLAASLDNSQLLLAFRAPQTDTTTRDTAVIIPVDVATLFTTPAFGTPIELDLGGRGIRSIEKANDGSGYLIIAGPAGAASAEVTHDFRLFTWDGLGTTVTELDNNLDALRDATGGSFETIVGLSSINPGTCVQLLQDNGDTTWAGQTEVSKDLDPADQQFMGNVLKLGNAVSDATGPVLVSSSPEDDATNAGICKNIVLKFNEGVQVNAGGNFIIRKSSDNSEVETIAANSSQVNVAFNTITINPSNNLDPATAYYLEADNSAVSDHNGNAWAGLSGASALNFTTLAAAPTYTLLISEVNSNATGGDFFELYNYGSSAIDLSGWTWDDESGDFNDAAAVVIPAGTSIAAGERIIFTSSGDEAAFRAAWNSLPTSTQVITSADPGLGKDDGVVVFNAAGQVAAAFNYDTTPISASDCSTINTATASTGITFKDGEHAGKAYGGTATVSAIWDGVSTSAPTYTYAQVGQLGAFAQTGDAASIGSPGLINAAPTLSIAADNAVQNEGNSGTTAFTFTVTRSGDTSSTASVDWTVSGAVQGTGSPYAAADADDFGGSFPSGSVNFAAGESSQTITVNVTGDTLPELDDQFEVTLSNAAGASITTGSATALINDDDLTQISTIQGSGTASAFASNGTTYTIEGVVTAWAPNLKGFYIQEEAFDHDNDSATSEGIFVYYGSTVPTGMDASSVGDIYRLSGVVTEYLNQTQISSPSSVTQMVDAYGLPTATGITLPVASLMNWEAVEGMLVEVSSATSGNALYASDTYTFARYGEITFYADAVPFQFTEFNTPSTAGYASYLDQLALNRIQLDDGNSAQNPSLAALNAGTQILRDGEALGELGTGEVNFVRVGDTASSITGVVGYGFGQYELFATQSVELTGNPRSVTMPSVGADAEVKVGSFNVLNYFTTLGTASFTTPEGNTQSGRGATNATEFAQQEAKIVEAIIASGAHVLGLNELQNNGEGPTSAIASLVNALNTAVGSNKYAYVSGHATGSDAIRVALIYDQTVVQTLGSAATPDASYTAFADYSRLPVAQTFAYIGDDTKQFTVAVNHLKSKGSVVPGDEDTGDGQGNNNNTRVEAVTQLDAWLNSNPTGATDGDYILLGDLNSYRMEDPITYLEGQGYTHQGATGDYSYIFNGLRGSLDHILTKGISSAEITGLAHFNINSDEQIALDYNDEYGDGSVTSDLDRDDMYRSSDHDPVVIGLKLNSESGSPAPDGTAPTLSSSTPADEAVNVAPTADLVLNFSENVQQGTGNVVIYRYSDDTVFDSIDINGTNVSVSGAQITINPNSDLAADESYYVTMAVGVIEDLAGNDYAGLTGNEALDFTTASAPSTPVFISELHYDNDGTDTDEGVGIMGAAGTDLTGWSLVLYNGGTGASYNTISLSGTVDDEGSGYGELWFGLPSNGLQNGSPDGLALIDNNGRVLQFLSYEGVLTAVDGEAAGMTSVDIGVSEASSATVGHSVQLVGTGHIYEDFSWSGSSTNSMGSINLGITIA